MKRIIEYFNLDLNKYYTAEELCNIYFPDIDFIYKVWQEELDEKTEKRHELFSEGAKKYLTKK